MNARLKVLHQKSNVKQIKLQPVTVVGRSSECDLKIASNLVSRVHCRITVTDESVTVEDLGSANGTFVDGEALVASQPRSVNPGARLVIGPAEFVVEFVTSTTNTLVIKRSADGSRPGLQELRKLSSISDSELVVAIPGAASDEVGPDMIQVKPLVASTPPKTVEPSRASPQQPLSPKAGARPAAEVARPVQEPSVSKPVSKPPVAPVSSPPVAKVVSLASASVEETINRQVADTVPPKPSPLVNKPAIVPPSAPAAQKPPVAPVVPTPIVEFSGVEPSSAEDDTIQFSFGDGPEPQPPSKTPSKVEKAKPLKSLFSIFGSKQKPGQPAEQSVASSEPAPEPAAEPVLEHGAEPPAEDLGLGFGAADSEPESAEGESQVDDDFQNFLNQF